MKKQLTLPKCQSLLRFRDYVIVKKRSPLKNLRARKKVLRGAQPSKRGAECYKSTPILQ